MSEYVPPALSPKYVICNQKSPQILTEMIEATIVDEMRHFIRDRIKQYCNPITSLLPKSERCSTVPSRNSGFPRHEKSTITSLFFPYVEWLKMYPQDSENVTSTLYAV